MSTPSTAGVSGAAGAIERLPPPAGTPAAEETPSSAYRSSVWPILKRLLLLPPALFVVASLSFVLVSAIPSDPARVALGDLASKQAIAQFNHLKGLDKSVWHRYLDYLSNLFHGDLGTSYYTNRSVASELGHYVPPTIELVVLSLLVAFVVGMAVGIVGAYSRRRRLNRAAHFWTSLLQAIPDFALGLVLIYVFFSVLKVVPPPIGQLGIIASNDNGSTNVAALSALLDGNWSNFALAFDHLLLPVITLGLVYSAYFSRVALSVLETAFRSPQIAFARSCGLPEHRVIRYALLDARAPILTYVAILFGFLVGGEAVVETVFAWQGLGQWTLSSLMQLDLPVIQGYILVTGGIVLITYVALDAIALALDPRMR